MKKYNLFLSIAIIVVSLIMALYSFKIPLPDKGERRVWDEKIIAELDEQIPKEKYVTIVDYHFQFMDAVRKKDISSSKFIRSSALLIGFLSLAQSVLIVRKK